MSVEEYLTAQRTAAAAERAELWGEIEGMYKKKLWHQLTVFLEENINTPLFAGGLLPLYERFICKFEDRINQLSLVKILLEVSKQQPNPSAAVDFLSRFREKAKKTDQAFLLLLSSIADLQLNQNNLSAAKELIDACTPVLESFVGVTPVHYAYYRVSARYHKTKADYVSYYGEALRFLGCVDLETIPRVDQEEWAFDLGIAALVGETIYNFGELLSHPVLASLNGTGRAWLVALLQAFNAGDAVAVASSLPVWSANANLNSSQPQLREKLKLLSLMELVYRAPAHERSLSFASIAAAAGVPENEVEVLTIRALSRGLVKGSIDGVERVAHLYWVQPRVLDQRQLSAMHDNIQKWIGTVRDAADQVRAHGAEILVE